MLDARLVAPDWAPLEACVAAVARPGRALTLGVCAVAPDGQSWRHNADRQFPSASTAKVAVLVETHRQLDRGELRLDDTYELKPAHKAAGSGVLRHLHEGLSLTLADLLYLMIAISDNTATNVLIAKTGMAHINTTMRALGMRDSILGRLMVGRLAIEGEQENLATPRDYARLLGAICNDQAASPDACRAMRDTLERQQNAQRIGRYVPREPGYSWGSKNGTNLGLVHDVGFVRGPAGTLLIAVYCQGVSDESAGEAIIAEVTRAAMRSTGLLPP